MPVTKIDPANLPSLEHRWDAREITGLSNGDPVSTWEDSAGTSDVTQSGGARPTYQTNVQNGLPGVYFDGSDWLEGAVGSAANRSARTLIAVMRLEARPSKNMTVLAGFDSSSSRWSWSMSANASRNGEYSFWDSSNGWTDTTKVLDLDHTYIVAMEYEGGEDTLLCADMVDVHPGRESRGAIPTHTRWVVGTSQIGGANNEIEGWVHEILVFDEVLPRSTREGVEAWLADVWDPERADRYTYEPSGTPSSGKRTFGGDTLSEQPAGTTKKWSETDWTVISDASAIEGRAVECDTKSEWHGLAIDAAGTPTDVETIVHGWASSQIGGATLTGSAMRAGDGLLSARPNPGIWVQNRTSSPSGLQLRETVSGDYVMDVRYPPSVGTGNWYWIHTQLWGDVLRAKMWTGELGDAPAEWRAVVEVDTDTAGWVGAMTFTDVSGTQKFDYYAWGINGESPPAPEAAALWSVPGGATHESATVVVRMSAEASVELELDTDPEFGDPATIGPLAADSSNTNCVRFGLTGLSADTRYYYRPVVDAGDPEDHVGSFRTPPAAGTAHSYVVATSGDSLTESEHGVFGQIEEDPGAVDIDLFIHLGDLHYEDIATESTALFRDAYDRSLGTAAQNAAYRARAWNYVWDDHDYGPNDSDRTSASRPAAQRAYRERVPHYTLPAADPPEAPIYHAFTWGRVRFVVTDLRSERDPNSQTDDENKTLLGDDQKAWFKQELLDAKAAGLAIVWVCTIPWPGTLTDNWGSFSTEREELGDFFQTHDLLDRMAILSADWHALALDDGSSSNFAETPVGNGPPIFHAASLDRWASGDPPFTPSEGFREPNWPDEGQYALLHVTDTGGATLQIKYEGYYYDQETETRTLWKDFTATLDADAPSVTTTSTGEGQSVATTEFIDERETISTGEGQSLATATVTHTRNVVSQGLGQSLASQVATAERSTVSVGEGQSLATTEFIGDTWTPCEGGVEVDWSSCPEPESTS